MSAFDDERFIEETRSAMEDVWDSRDKCMKAVLAALRALPVHARMAAMGMREVRIGGYEYEIDWEDGSPVRADWNEMAFWTEGRGSSA